jgi:AcrR family transcriptional regulator
MAEINQELVSKILELFSRYGIRSVTTSDIARELGISKKTLYENFADKSDMIEQTITLTYKRLEAKYEEIQKKELGAINSLFTIYQQVNELLKNTSPTMKYDLQKYYPELFSKVSKNFNEMIYNMHVENMNQGKAEGVYRDVDADIIARMLVHNIQSDMLEAFSPEELYSERVNREIFLYHLFGICNEKGYAQVNSWINRDSNS